MKIQLCSKLPEIHTYAIMYVLEETTFIVNMLISTEQCKRLCTKIVNTLYKPNLQ